LEVAGAVRIADDHLANGERFRYSQSANGPSSITGNNGAGIILPLGLSRLFREGSLSVKTDSRVGIPGPG
jgi:hypothetical protein